MDRLWSPWRYRYVAGEDKETATRCIFCVLRDAPPTEDERNLIVHRARRNFIVLNLYPYTSGHLMIVPHEHVADLDAASKEVTDEMMDLAKKAQTVLREVYRPDGFNLGMNIGKAAGAGVAGHIHLHLMPRWVGDSNFMTTVGETRVLPEDLATTYAKLRPLFEC